MIPKWLNSGWSVALFCLTAITGIFAMERLNLTSDWELPVTSPAPRIDCEPLKPDTVYLFYHPHCPCTMATVRQLQRLQPVFPPETSFIAFAYIPKDKDKSWIDGRTTETIRMIPGAQIEFDWDAESSISAGVKYSGHVLYVNRDSRVTFSGGIVVGKNHERGSVSCQAFVDTLKRTSSRLQRFPIFGCPLRDPQFGASVPSADARPTINASPQRHPDRKTTAAGPRNSFSESLQEDTK